MLGRPGFTWNCQVKMIKVDKGKTWREYVKVFYFEQLVQLCFIQFSCRAIFSFINPFFYVETQSNPFTEKMRFKSWPYYHHWCEIFGKERATLDKSQSKVNDDRSERNTNDVPPVGEKGFTLVHQRSTNLTGNESKSTREESTATTSVKLVELMGAFCEATKSSFTELTKKISVDYDMQTQRKTVYEALGEIGQLSVAQRVHVAKLLVNNNNELDLFFSLPREAKVEMVRQLIGERLMFI